MELEEDYSDYHDDYSESNGYYEIEQFKRADSMAHDNQDILFQRTNAYYIMDPHRTEKYIEELVNDLRDTWGVTESTAFRLLKKFQWDKEKASSNLTEGDNLDSMEVGGNSQKAEEFDCPICYTTESIKDGCSFGCSHYYCRDCFTEYVRTAINDGTPFKTCATEGCKEILTPKTCFNYFRNDEAIYNKYKRFLLQTIVDTSFNLLWCPGTGCLNIIQLLKMKKFDRSLLNIRCPCGYCFCFACRDVAHRPLQCDNFAKWMAQVGGKDDSLNTGWIQKNSKACPQCKVYIEKNQGCMHMTCRNCHHEFCWICMTDWKKHNSGSFYNCNNFKESSEKQMTNEQKEFEKFNFYRDRFEQHWNSLKHAIKKKKTILNNFKEINHQVQSMKDDVFLTEALDLIIEARRAITMTYAAGYYRKFSELQKDVYEMQQSMLWTALDNLDKFTDNLQEEAKMESLLVDVIQETKFLAGKYSDYKVQLTNKTGGVVAACNKLLKSMEDESEFEKNTTLRKQQSKVSEFDYIPEDYDEKFISDYWYCAFCTFANPRESQTCEMCNNPKRVLEGDLF
jgi:ariadne-1